MTTPDPLATFLDQLDATATAATPGPRTGSLLVVAPHRGVIARCPTPQKGGVFECVDNGKLIAACDPERIRALVAVARAADAVADGACCYATAPYGNLSTNPEVDVDEVEALKRALAQLRTVAERRAP